jgi:hypothetical protein
VPVADIAFIETQKTSVIASAMSTAAQRRASSFVHARSKRSSGAPHAALRRTSAGRACAAVAVAAAGCSARGAVDLRALGQGDEGFEVSSGAGVALPLSPAPSFEGSLEGSFSSSLIAAEVTSSSPERAGLPEGLGAYGA